MQQVKCMIEKKEPIFNLDEEEQALSDSVDQEEWVTIDNLEEKVAFSKKAAFNYLCKKARVNIRMSESDLKRIKQIAAFEGLPYQSLITSVLHKYSSGHFSER